MELKAFSPRDADLLVRVARKVLGEPGRPLDARDGQVVLPPDGLAFINDSGEDMLPGSIGAIKDYEATADGILYAVIEKPSTTFRTRHVVNTCPKEIPADGVGFFEFSNRYRIRYDTGTPAKDEGWGPKPGQWTLSKGFPCTTLVDGIVDSTNKLLLGTLSPITTLLCKATSDLSAGAVSSNYVIWRGTMASGADAGFTTLPSIELKHDIADDDFFIAHLVNGGWVSESSSEGACPA